MIQNQDEEEENEKENDDQKTHILSKITGLGEEDARITLLKLKKYSGIKYLKDFLFKPFNKDREDLKMIFVMIKKYDHEIPKTSPFLK